MVKIKLCGLSRVCDILWANELKPDFVGFVFAAGHRQVTDEEAEMYRKLLDPSIPAVGVFVNEKPELVAAIANAGIIQYIQLHGDEDESYIWRLRILTKAPIIKAFSIVTSLDMDRAETSSADYVLLDHGVGGTGQSFDWSQWRPIDKPYFLAGGLTADNVGEAIKMQPFAVDVSSGVETYGVKDKNKIEEFMTRARIGPVPGEAL